jgi:RNA polymerase sigma-70 factor (ECF subfamily)
MFRTPRITGHMEIYSRISPTLLPKCGGRGKKREEEAGNRGINARSSSYTYGAVSDESLPGGSFEELAMPLFDSLYNFARWLTRDREEAEDLVQETYSKALKGFASFQPGTNFRAWIFRILRNTFLTSRTGLKSGMTISLDSEEGEAVRPATAETPESLLLARSDQRMVQEAIAEVPVIFREVLLLCDVEEMSYQEIAETVAIPIGTVLSRLARARSALRLGLTKKLQGV